MNSKGDAFARSAGHLASDPHLGAFVRRHGPIAHRRAHSRGTFRALAESIIYQQLSGKAADTICARFVALFPGKRFPKPEDVLKMKMTKLRRAGLSRQKALYLKDLAKKCLDGTIVSRNFSRMTDAEIIEHVSAVKGIGEWSAQMFLMFTLRRPDVLPTGDLGIQKGFQKVFKLRAKPSSAQMERLGKRWSGHRTTACFYLWRLLDEK